MADYNRKPQIFIKRGMNVTLSGDRLSPEWFQYIRNVRSYRAGEWMQRPGMRSVGSVTDAVYYLSRINDNLNGTFRRLAGTLTGKVYVDDSSHTSFSQVDSGYGGRQYSSIISRPDRSPLPFLFIGSDTRNSKFSTTGERTEWGLSAPLSPPDVRVLGMNYVLIEDPGNTFSTSFTPSTGAVTAINRFPLFYAGSFFFDSGSAPGMANVTIHPLIFPPPTDALQVGMCIVLDDEQVPGSVTERTIIEEVFFPIATTTVTGVKYDSGVSGLCTIQLATPTESLKRNTLVSIFSAGTVRVLSVTLGPDGLPSFRCNTGSFTAKIGDSVTGIYSFRCFIRNTGYNNPGSPPVTGTRVQARYEEWAGASSGIQSVTKTGTFNFAIANIFQGGSLTSRSIQADDLFHISLRADYTKFTEIQIQFDVGDGTFTQNYYFVTIRSPDLYGAYIQRQLSVDAQQTQIQRIQSDSFVEDQGEGEYFPLPRKLEGLGELSRQNLDSVNIQAGQGLVIGSGDGAISITSRGGLSQWIEVFVPMSQFQRVGTGPGDWTAVKAIRLTTNFNAGSSGFDFDDLYIAGTFGPDTTDLSGYTYIYRGRNTSTGSRSNPSPPTRYMIDTRRRLVNIAIPTYSDPQADVFDIFRIGGLLQDYYFVATVPASVSVFQDDLEDSVVLRNPQIEVNRFKPWPSPDTPKSGTCDLVGTSVGRLSGDLFNIKWVRGTQIIINNRVFTLYSNPSSTEFLELNESGGYMPGAKFQMPEPLLDGQTYPTVFGPYAGASGEFLFAVGDPRNPGYLFWTNGNDPESSSDVNLIEVCSPSERLMNGCVLDGIVYVFSDRGSWRILPSFQGGQSGGGSDFYSQKTAMGKGLATRWGLAIGDAIYFVSYDGIYRSRGDAIESLTDDSLSPLFRRDVSEIPAINFGVPVAPISFDPLDEDESSLTYSLDGLYFTYKGIDGNRYTFYLSFFTGGWVLDQISLGEIIRTFREVQYPQEDQISVGTSNGLVLLRDQSQFTDNGSPISCRVWDREEIWGDLRGTKQVGDVMVDTDPAGATIGVTSRYENNTSNDILSNITGSGRDQFVRDINSGSGRIVRGVALDVTWSNGASGFPKVYAWEPAALVKPEESVNRATDWDNGGYTGTKWLQGFRLRGDTLGLQKTFQVEIDGGTFVETFNFTASAEQVQAFSLTNPVVCHEMRIRGTDSDLYRLMGVEWVFEPEPEMAAVWETQVTSFDLPFYSHMREVMIAHRSTSDISMIVTTDNVSNSYTILHGSGGRVRSYLPVKGLKAKYHKFRFTSSAPFGLWIKDIECRVGAWGRTESYTIQRPFGDISRAQGGARL